jgi:hypothetical protein
MVMTSRALSVCALLLVVPVSWGQSTALNANSGGKEKKTPTEVKPGQSVMVPAEKKPATPSNADLRRVLGMTVDMPTPQRLQVQDVLNILAEKLGARGERLDIFVDQAAIKSQVPDLKSFFELEVNFATRSGHMTVQQVLEQIASETSVGVDVTYLLRQHRVEIVPVDNARIDYLLDRGATIEFKDTPVSQAIDELSDAAGLTIAVDPRCGSDVLSKPISLRAGQDMSVRGVLECLADMNDLRLIIDEHRVFLTTEAQYLKRLRSRLDEAKLQREHEPMINVPNAASFGLGGLGGMGGGMVVPVREPERPRQYGRRPRLDGASQ